MKKESHWVQLSPVFIIIENQNAGRVPGAKAQRSALKIYEWLHKII
jgi:hypothetical protein